MILIDPREGSKDLLKPLTDLGLPTKLQRLEFGDLAFIGRGEQGAEAFVGIEFKKLAECLSSLRSGRLQGFQAPGMQSAYDFRWLLIQGDILFNKRGILMQWVQVGHKKQLRPILGHMTITEFEKRILQLHLQWGLNPKFTTRDRHTYRWIEGLYRAWTDTDLDQHKSHLTMYQPATMTPLSNFRQAVGRWPGVGLAVSKAAERTFGSVRRAAMASIDEWATLETTDQKGKKRKFGKISATKVVTFLQGETT